MRVLWGVDAKLQKKDRKEGQPICGFISRLKDLNLFVLQLLKKFVHGLNHEDIHNSIVIIGMTTWNEFIANAIELEDNSIINGYKFSSTLLAY